MRMLRRKIAAPAEDPERQLSYEIAEQVFEARQRLGLTQAELAKLAKASQPAVSAVESAVRLPTLGLLLKLAATMNLRVVVRFKPKEER